MEPDEQVPVTVRVYVPGGVPGLPAGDMRALAPPPAQAAIASIASTSAAKVAKVARLRPTPGCARPWIAQVKLPDATRAIVQTSQGRGRAGRVGGGGLCRGTPSDGAVVETVTVTFVEDLLKVTEVGETVQRASEGAPVQVRATESLNTPVSPKLKA